MARRAAPAVPTAGAYQAVESAESYLDMGGFSRQDLIEQLTSDAGDGYTRAQAEYAVDQVGL